VDRFLDAYRPVQAVHQQVRLVVTADRPHVVFDGGHVFQVHAGDVREKPFPFVVVRGQRENLAVVVRGQQVLLVHRERDDDADHTGTVRQPGNDTRKHDVDTAGDRCVWTREKRKPAAESRTRVRRSYISSAANVDKNQ